MKNIYKSFAICLLSTASLSASAMNEMDSMRMNNPGTELPKNMHSDNVSGHSTKQMNTGKSMRMHKGMDGMEKGMGGMGISEDMRDKMGRAEQKYILERDELSDKIRDTKNSTRKARLMAEQLELIKDRQDAKRMMKRKMMHNMMMKKKMKMKM